MWNSKSNTNPERIQEVIENIKKTNCFNEDPISKIKYKLLNIFLPQYHKQWLKVLRKKKTFQSKYSSYLNQYFTVKFEAELNVSNKLQ